MDVSAFLGQSGTYHFRIPYPSNDALHPGEFVTIGAMQGTGSSSQPFSLDSSGLAYAAQFRQSLAAELIRDGASATTGDVAEPGEGPDPEAILYEYAAGNSWVESAYMGCSELAWQDVVVGDPLMAPFAMHPTVDFLDPSPDDQTSVAGYVTLPVDAEPDMEGLIIGSIQQVEFDQIDSSGVVTTLAIDTAAAYYAVWNTTTLAGGTYTVRVTALQTGAVVGSGTGSNTFVVDNTIPPISLDSAASWVINSQTTISATAQGNPSSVEFWLFNYGEPESVATCSASPYQCQISSSNPDGVYQLQVIARYADGSSYYGVPQPITLMNDSAANPSIGGLVSQTPDGSPGWLIGAVVTADTNCNTLGTNASGNTNTFYVEDVNRSGGIRIEAGTTSAPVSVVEGEVVMIHGLIHKTVTGTSPRERYIEADEVDSVGFQAVPGPLGMTNQTVGGAAPAGSPGVLAGSGLLNVGMLVRVWGNVTYVGDDCFYIQDGSHLYFDGNIRQSWVEVPLDGSPLSSTANPVGLRVYCGSLAKPSLGDYVAATGLSSTFKIGSNIVRCVRMRGSASTPPGTNPDLTNMISGGFEAYTQAAKEPTWQWSPSWDGNYTGVLVTTDTAGHLQQLSPGSKVRLDGALVESQTGTGPSDGVLRLRHYDWNMSPKMTGTNPVDSTARIIPEATKLWWPLFVNAYTALNVHDAVTILGTSYVNSSYDGDQWIVPDRIYKRYPTSTPSDEFLSMCSLSMTAAGGDSASNANNWAPGDSEPGGGPIGPSASYDDSWVLQTDWFKAADSQIGAIGWALSQPDSTVVDLPMERVVSVADGGQTLAIKEWFEPATPAPRLVLELGSSVQGLVDASATIDIIGGTLTTLPDGQRALINPEAVYVYLDDSGNIASPIPPFKLLGNAPTWQWKQKIAP